jgi:hypothetical protein
MAMADIIPDGQPIEEPEASAAAAYQNIPAPLGQFLGEQIGSTVRQIGRVAEQGMFEGAGAFPQLLYGLAQAGTATPEATVGGVPSTTEVTPPGSVPTPLLSPEDYNARYAPNGPDGKPVSLGSEPMPQGIAKLVGDAKREEIERDNVSSRFENAHSWPANFAAGTLGFMLDPLRAATAFVPGLGEEAVLARLGTGIAARLGARVVAGATAGAAAQAPLAALQYGLGQEEASDYGLRDAFRDMAFAAAGNAIFHTGIGTAGEILRGRPEAAAEAPMEFREAAPIVAADAQTQHAAMSSAVAEIADGRPVDVEPMFQLKTPEPIEGFRFLPPPPRPYRPGELEARQQAQGPAPSDIAVQQRELYHDGFAPGVPGSELRESSSEIYEPELHEMSPRELISAAERRYNTNVLGQQMAPEGATDAEFEDIGPPPHPAAPAEAAAPETAQQQPGITVAPTETPLLTAIPTEPERLINFLRRNGGVQDEGGDIRQNIGGVRGRPGLVNNRSGMPLDEAALRAWQDGYLPGAERPSVNSLLDAIDEDHKGQPRYSQIDEGLVAERQEALARNSEIDRLSQNLGIETQGKSAAQFWDEVSDRLSMEDAAREADSLADAHETAFAEAEARAKAWMEERGGGWEPDELYQRGEPRSLDDLEREFREREAAAGMAEGAGGAAGPGLAGDREGALQAGERQGGGGAGPAGRAEPATERTEQGQQYIIPGAKQSAAQAAAAREAEGRGRIRAAVTQAAPGGMFEQRTAEEPGLFDMAQAQQTIARIQGNLLPEERDEIAAAQRGLGDAETKAAAIDEAANCLKEAGL